MSSRSESPPFEGPLLAVRSLSVYRNHPGRREPDHRAHVLVDNISFDIGRGETVGIVGESGSGKSLTAKALVALLPRNLSSDGSIKFDGRELLHSPDVRHAALRGRDISLLLQDPFTMLNPVMTAGEHIAETIRTSNGQNAMRGLALNQEVTRRLREVGIDDPSVADRYPFQLSGGISQRVAIAASLAGDPRLLIADEPTTALDTTTQKEVIELLLSVQRARRMSLILITHDLRLAFSACDRIMVMYAGSIAEIAPSDGLAISQAHPYSRDLVRAVPSSTTYQRTLVDIPGTIPAASSVRTQCGYAARCEYAVDGCRTHKPELIRVGENRSSACARVDQLVGILSPTTTAVFSNDAHDARPTAGSAGQPILKVTDLCKTYGRPGKGQVALGGVTFSVAVGESVGIVGESGSGKTTIARILLGLERPSGGRVEVEGADVSDFAALSREQTIAARRAIQCVFQDPYSSLNPKHSIGYALTEALNRRGVQTRSVDDEVGKLLERVGLPSTLAASRPSALSGGQRQRVAIARALAVEPRMLICDEPVASLDVSVQAQILRLLRELHAESALSLVFITHDLAVVRQVTDRVIVLDKGLIVEHGHTDTVLDAPAHSATRRLVAAVP
jgi:peptide/nickel transport system ATP-binding protein